VAFVVPAAACAALLLAYNAALTGDPLYFPVNRYFDEHAPPADSDFFRYRPGCNRLGFGPDHGCDLSIRHARHTLGNGLSNVGDNMTAWMLLLGGGPLFAALAVGAVGLRRREAAPWILLAVPAATVVLYMTYWHGGTCFGARYLHVAAAPTLLLAAVGLASVRRAAVTIGILGVWLALNTWSFGRAWNVIADRYWGTDTRYVQLAAPWKGPKGLIMVGFAEGDPPVPWREKAAGTAFLPPGAHWTIDIVMQSAIAVNDPRLQASVLFAKFHPALVGDLRARFPDRELWLYVHAPDRSEDRLVRWSSEAIAASPDQLFPADNFPGFRVELTHTPRGSEALGGRAP